MASRVRGSEFQTTIVCIDSYQDGVLVGRFYNPHLKDGESFRSLSQFLLKFEQALDGMNLPQSFTEPRAFAPVSHTEGSHPTHEPQKGALATFSLRVLFRQNASWQGTVTWLEGNIDERFRSVLELIHLLDSTLRIQSTNAETTTKAYA